MKDVLALLEYKHPALEAELRAKTHPELVGLLSDLTGMCIRLGFHVPVVTCLGRTPESNASAGGREDSWHLCDCAADLRIWVWERETVLPVVLTWLRGEVAKRGGKRKWGLLAHDAGSGRHVHLERRDAQWRLTYAARTA